MLIQAGANKDIGLKMKQWWVNQNQTYNQEVHGGYPCTTRQNGFQQTLSKIYPLRLLTSQLLEP
jgi:hypothetical protein